MAQALRANGRAAAGTEEANQVSPDSKHLHLCRNVKKLNVAVGGHLEI